MECPRCGEDNLPGLALCLGCGQDLNSNPADLVINTVPRVRAGNPLQHGMVAPDSRARPSLRRWLSDPQVVTAHQLLRTCVIGLPPGLGAARRGDRRMAVQLLGAFLGCGLAWFLLWHSVLQPFAWMGALSVMASSAVIEARARNPGRGLALSFAATAFAVSLTLGVNVLMASAFDTWVPRVVLADTQSLPGGYFIIDRVDLDELAVDQLVAVGQREAFWSLRTESVTVAPVLALPGQLVERDAQGLRVDGLPSTVHALNPSARPPRLAAGGVVVPPNHVALLADPVTMVRPDQLAGRLTYRWLPQADRGPLHWPPLDVTLEPQTPEHP